MTMSGLVNFGGLCCGFDADVNSKTFLAANVGATDGATVGFVEGTCAEVDLVCAEVELVCVRGGVLGGTMSGRDVGLKAVLGVGL